ncbi:hypothetical protein D7X33_20225 [Butyricicoccus sp. 1XD8-22]|nr:hypothetical protein D7X33_20225 [Butyricicoccus sp. 1XD8-22]
MRVIDYTRKKAKAPLICSLLLTIPMLTACMEVPKEALEEAETENKENHTATESGNESDSDTSIAPSNDSEPEELFTEQQQELIDGMEEVTPEDAVKNSIGKSEVEHEVLESTHQELTKIDKFTDLDEFSTYMGELFFQYHSGTILGEEFLDFAEPHMDETFIEQLPTDREARIAMFDTLQALFNEGLKSDIASYVVTKSDRAPIFDEVIFYREYTLNDGSTMYYQTTAKKVDEHWMLVDDVPTTNININK